MNDTKHTQTIFPRGNDLGTHQLPGGISLSSPDSPVGKGAQPGVETPKTQNKGNVHIVNCFLIWFSLILAFGGDTCIPCLLLV